MANELSIQVGEKKVATDGIVGMVFLLSSETMFFAGLISAYIVNRAETMEWPPFGQPRLPIAVTAINTIVLLLSGFLMMRFRKINKDVKGDSVKSVNLLNTAILSGATFLIIQGSEWVQLIRFGLTTRSSLYGAFFYTIIGAHAIHVFAGLLALLYLHSCTRKANVKNLKSKLDSCGIYWYFVVSIWPILYYLVYLS